ncbi:MAG: glycosyltransferase, partial [Acidimicrobiales bacterium]
MKVLCTCLPGFGHFNPLVPVARALTRAGHEVAFATAESFCHRVRSAGFTAFPAGLSLSDQLEAARLAYPRLHALPPGTRRFEEFVPRMLAGVAAPARAGDLVPVVRQWKPDLMVHDEAELAAPVAAAIAGIPWASHSIVLLRPRAMVCRAGETLAALCRSWGVDLGPLGGLYRYLHLDACPPSLQAPGIDDIPVAHPIRNTEDSDTAEGDADLPSWVSELPHRPTVYVTLGTVFNRDPGRFRAILTGLGDEAVNVIATLGHGADPAGLGHQPDNVHLEGYVPLSLLLAHLDVMVTQGGTSILPALGRGLPLLVVPQGADQFHNAEACLHAGVGRRL